VVRENNQTYRLGWTEQCKDGTKMGVGCPEYVLIFRKPQTDATKGFADVPVIKSKKDYSRARWQIDAHAFWRSSGDRLLTVEEMENMLPKELVKAFQNRSLETVYDYSEHVKVGESLDGKNRLPTKFMALAPGSHSSNVWHDIVRMLTLNSEQSKRNVANHVCPLQLDLIERLIVRYSNEGDVVYDPFGGIMSVPFKAVKLGRIGRGVELNESYFRDGLRYLRRAESEMVQPTMFDFMDMEMEKAS
jgi:hypothetical protein